MPYLVTYLLLINVADFVTTNVLLSRRGFYEWNPLLLSLMKVHETPYTILLTKMVLFGLLAFFLALLNKHSPTRYNRPYLRLMLVGINLGLTGVVIRSLYLIYT